MPATSIALDRPLDLLLVYDVREWLAKNTANGRVHSGYAYYALDRLLIRLVKQEDAEIFSSLKRQLYLKELFDLGISGGSHLSFVEFLNPPLPVDSADPDEGPIQNPKLVSAGTVFTSFVATTSIV